MYFMELIRNETRICNNCNDKKETRVFEITINKNTICLCISCLDELKYLIHELELLY